MLNKPKYRSDWEWKRQWYLDNGFVEGETLFTTRGRRARRSRRDDIRHVADEIARGSDRLVMRRKKADAAAIQVRLVAELDIARCHRRR